MRPRNEEEEAARLRNRKTGGSRGVLHRLRRAVGEKKGRARQTPPYQSGGFD
jgi:hypothetical protein